MPSRRHVLSLTARSLLLAAAGPTLLAACGDDSSPGSAAGGAPRSGGTLTLAEPTSPIGWDPHVGTEDVLGLILRPVLDSLVAEQPGGTYAPWLASSWKVSPDGLTYTFTLRTDVTFSDGTPFDAAAVKANFDHVVAPATKSRYAKLLLGPYAGTDIVDTHTVAVRLTAPHSQLLHGLSTTYLGFHSPRALREHPADIASGGKFIIGTGAYLFDSVVQGQKAVFTRRTGYGWAPSAAPHRGDGYLDGYTVLFVLDDQSRLGAALAGQVSIADQLPAAQLATLQGRSEVTLHSNAVPGSPYIYYLNTQRPFLKDLDARRAILHGVDIASITKGVFQGRYDRAGSVLSPSTPGYDPSVGGTWGYDKAKAESLLDGLGWSTRDADGYRTRDGQRFVLRFPFATANTTAERRTYDTALQDALKKIGIQLVLTELDAPTYIKREIAGDYDVSGLANSSPTPSVLWDLFLSTNTLDKGGANKAWVKDPQLDDLLSQAEKTSDIGRQNDLYQQVQRRVIDQAYGLPTYVAKRSLAVRGAVHGFAFDTAGWPVLRDLWLSGS